MVLLVVDTQKSLVNDELYNYNEFIDNIQLLIKKARENNVEVIYVVHDDGIGSGLTKGTDGFEVFEKFKPLSNEKLFVKSVNSAFKDTGLVEYLAENNDGKDKWAETNTAGSGIGGHGLVMSLKNAGSTKSDSRNDFMKNYQYIDYQFVKTALIDNYSHILSRNLGSASI